MLLYTLHIIIWSHIDSQFDIRTSEEILQRFKKNLNVERALIGLHREIHNPNMEMKSCIDVSLIIEP